MASVCNDTAALWLAETLTVSADDGWLQPGLPLELSLFWPAQYALPAEIGSQAILRALRLRGATRTPRSLRAHGAPVMSERPGIYFSRGARVASPRSPRGRPRTHAASVSSGLLGHDPAFRSGSTARAAKRAAQI